MPEFLHEVVRRRERNNSRPTYLQNAYNDLMREMEESYQRMRVDMRAQEAIDRYMSMATSNPTVGMTMDMPVLDINAPANASLVTQHVTYQFTGIVANGYRGWVRIN